jgi:hypothetical protein
MPGEDHIGSDLGYGAANSVEANAYKVAEASENTRCEIMAEIKNALTTSNNEVDTDVTLNVESLGGIDISSGPGALVLDDVLQKLSTIQQTAAQILASKNRSAKEVQQLMR